MNGRLVLAAVALLGAAPAAAQYPPPGGAPAGMVPGPGGGGPGFGRLSVQQLAPSVYWVEGAGGNTGFIIGDTGVTVIDATIAPPLARKLLDAIAKITPKPVRTVILTHGDIDHVGGLAAFPAGITIIAQDNTKTRMAAGTAAGHVPVPPDRLPNRTVATKESVTIDGVRLELLHWAPAHTDGDLVIFLPAQKIVFTGDIFALDQPAALIHRDQHGNSAGWVTTAKAILALKADRFVVGHGGVQSRQGIEDRVARVAAERQRIKAMAASGKSLPEIEAAVGDPPPGPDRSPPGSPHFAPFPEVVYQELTGGH